MVIRGEEGAECAVDEACNQDFAVVGLAFALHEAAGIAAACGVFLLIFYLKGHEVRVGFRVLGRYHGRQQHRVALLHDHGAVGLLGQLAGLDHNLASVGERYELLHGIVQFLFFHDFIYL